MQGAQFLTYDILSSRFELLEGSKCLRLVLKQMDCLEAREVINEGHPIAISLVRSNLHWAMHIAVDKLERSGRSGLRSWEGI